MATATKKKVSTKPKVYTICKANRVQNSPYFIEGTDMQFDVVHEFPLPLETEGFNADGDPVAIRFISSCPTVLKEDQIERGWPEVRKPKESERQMLTFIGGMLYVPAGYENLVTYLEMSPWFKGEEGKKRPPDSRIIFEEYNQEALDDELLKQEEMIGEAKAIILKADKSTLISLLHLNSPGLVLDQNMDVKQAKLSLLQIANRNPDFILRGYKVAKTDLTILVSKAIDYRILDIDTAKKVKIKDRGSDKYSDLATVLDTGGRNLKIERTVMFLEGKDGKEALSEIKALVKEHEDKLALENEEDGQEEFVDDGGTGAQ